MDGKTASEGWFVPEVGTKMQDGGRGRGAKTAQYKEGKN